MWDPLTTVDVLHILGEISETVKLLMKTWENIFVSKQKNNLTIESKKFNNTPAYFKGCLPFFYKVWIKLICCNSQGRDVDLEEIQIAYIELVSFIIR